MEGQLTPFPPARGLGSDVRSPSGVRGGTTIFRYSALSRQLIRLRY